MIEPRPVDVLIIGAGINGAGLFHDLCLQGLTCVIVDKGDFGSGTSAAPSRLIHGGIKYLETGELRLVAESTLERNLLLRNAPHLVKPLQTVIPMFSWLKGIGAAVRTLLGSTVAPRSRGALLIEIGLAMYDFYGRRTDKNRHLMRTFCFFGQFFGEFTLCEQMSLRTILTLCPCVRNRKCGFVRELDSRTIIAYVFAVPMPKSCAWKPSLMN